MILVERKSLLDDTAAEEQGMSFADVVVLFRSSVFVHTQAVISIIQPISGRLIDLFIHKLFPMDRRQL